MSDPRPARDDEPILDPPRKEAPAGDPGGRAPLPKDAPAGEVPAERAPDKPEPDKPEPDKPRPVERIQKLRLGIRVVWWSAVVLSLVFAGVALWMGVARGDPFALFFALLAACCALAGFGTLSAVRRPSST